MSPSPYADPRALRSAIADRLRPLANERGVQLTNLQRQFAYDRLLCRVFTDEPARWVLKGGTAMLARIGAEARHTRDIDLLSREGGLREAERALQAAARLDLEDFFTFTLGPGQHLTEGVHALRVSVDAHLGLKRFAQFHVDLVAELTMTGSTDTVSGLVPTEIPGLKQATSSPIRSSTTSPTRCARSTKRTSGRAACKSPAVATATWPTWPSLRTRSKLTRAI